MKTKSLVSWGLLMIPFISAPAVDAQSHEYYDTSIQDEVRRFLNPETDIDVTYKANVLAAHIDENASDLDAIREAIRQDVVEILNRYPDDQEVLHKRLITFFDAMDRVIEDRERARSNLSLIIHLSSAGALAVTGIAIGLMIQKKNKQEETWREKGRRGGVYGLIGGGCGLALSMLVQAAFSSASPQSFSDSYDPPPSMMVDDPRPSDG